VCGNAVDEDCDGALDDADACPLFCAPGSTVSAATQTKRTKIKLKDGPDADKVLTKGTFTLPTPGQLVDPELPVTIGVLDGSGAVVFTATVPGALFTASGSRLTFKDKFAPYEYGGLQQVQFTAAGDGLTVKYKVKARALNLGALQGGTGAVVIKLGDRCFVDPADLCTLTAGLTCR
jgi:hypothetical protein